MNEQRASALQKKADEFALPVPKDPGVEGATEVRRRAWRLRCLGPAMALTVDATPPGGLLVTLGRCGRVAVGAGAGTGTGQGGARAARARARAAANRRPCGATAGGQGVPPAGKPLRRTERAPHDGGQLGAGLLHHHAKGAGGRRHPAPGPGCPRARAAVGAGGGRRAGPATRPAAARSAGRAAGGGDRRRAHRTAACVAPLHKHTRHGGVLRKCCPRTPDPFCARPRPLRVHKGPADHLLRLPQDRSRVRSGARGEGRGAVAV